MMSSLTRQLGQLSVSAASRAPVVRGLSFSASLRGRPLVAPQQRAAATVAVVQVQAKQNALRRQRRSERQRILNKSRKSAVATRMKKVLQALDRCTNEPPKSLEDLEPVDKLIAEAFSEIDKAKVKGTLHRNTAANRKSRLSRARKRVLLAAGLNKLSPTKEAASESSQTPDAEG